MQEILDILQRPVKIGDTVLTKGYYAVNLDTITTVTKILKNGIQVNVPIRQYNSDTHQIESIMKPLKRDSSSFIIINEQLQYNKTAYPEYCI